MRLSYTEKDRQNVKENVSLSALASSMGYSVYRKGAYLSIKEMDSVIIYNDRTWKRWSNKGNITGGSQIDFELAFGSSKTVPEAIHKLLDFINQPATQQIIVSAAPSGYHNNVDNRQDQLDLPPRNENYRRVFAYLMKTRGLSQEVVSYFAHNKLIYEESRHHNLVFCGYDPDGVIRYAGMRGTITYGNNSFKCDVLGNDKNYGVNLVNKGSEELKVFESVIDCMSYMDLTNDYDSNKLVLGMVADNPLMQFLKDYDHLKHISFCLDNDEAGQTSIYGKYGGSETEGYKDKYEKLGYTCSVEIPPAGKDWNEFLKDHQPENFYPGFYTANDFLKLGNNKFLDVDDQAGLPFRHRSR